MKKEEKQEELKEDIEKVEEPKKEEKQEVKKSYIKTEESNEDESKEDKKGYVAERVERAKEKAKEDLLNKVGFKSEDELLNALNKVDETNELVKKVAEKIENEEAKKITDDKKNKLIKVLEEEKVFDAEALITYVDLDKIEIENNSIKDKDTIVNDLKAKKPNFFGKEFIKTDSYQQSKGMTPNNEYKEDYEKGNYVSVINKYLKNNNLV